MPFAPSPRASQSQSLSSRRTDSFNAAPPPIAPKPGATPDHPIFTAVDDDLKDAKRVGTHGQEEDLRAALGKIILRVEELSTLLRVAYRTTTDLETSLEVAKSNLKLLEANNDMLEEALKRSDTSGAKEIGWRRWSAREGQQRELRIEEERPKSLDDGTLNKGAAVPPQTPSSAPSSAAVVSPTLPSPVPPPAVVPPAPTSQESRFFRGFRFASGSGANTPTTRASRSPTRSPSIANGASSPLNSPSLPSLIPESLKTLDTAREKEKELERQKEKEEREKKLEELTKELEKEKAAKIKATEDKTALEAEIESLSQALFEEANKMVAHERIKRAEAEDELREAKQEKEALRSALKLVEGENGRLRIVEEERERLEGRRAIDLRPSDDEEEEGRRRAMDGIRDLDAEAGPSQSRSSSRIGTKSPVLTPASIAADPEEASHDRSISISPSPDEYTTPMESRSQSYSSYDEPDSDPSASIDDGDDHKHEQVPDSGATESPGTPNASAYFSPPEPNFKPSTPGSYLAEEPSPWA